MLRTAIICSIVTSIVVFVTLVTDQKTVPITLEERIKDLTKSLNQAVSIISEIETEVGSRQALVERLQQDAQTAQNVINLNAKEAEAVAQLLRKEFDRDQNQSLRLDVLPSISFARSRVDTLNRSVIQGVRLWRTLETHDERHHGNCE